MEKINTNELKNFILEASRAAYASGDDSLKQKQVDGSKTIVYKNGSYNYNDNYFGGESYGGRSVIFLGDKPIWMMVYYGLVYPDIELKEVYGFLVEALSNSNIEMPYRGPALYEKDNWKYENKLMGDVGKFSGTEKIFKNDICIYEADYMGGLVDLK